MSYCQNCGSQLSNQATFCAQCGNAVSPLPVRGEAPSEAPMATQKQKKATGWKIMLGILMALSGLGGIIIAWGTILGFPEHGSDAWWLASQIVIAAAGLLAVTVGIAYLKRMIDFKVTAIAYATIGVVVIAVVLLYEIVPARSGFMGNPAELALGLSLIFAIMPAASFLLPIFMIERARKKNR